MIEKLFSLSGKTAVVTGGAKGLGGMISAALVEAGVRVYITSRKADDCEQFAGDMNGRDWAGSCVALPYDLSKTELIEQFVSDLSDSEDVVHLLINNAGTTWGAKLGEFPEKGWDKIMDLNLKAPFFLIQQMLPLLEKAGSYEDPARIINIGSSEGLHAPLMANYSYSASKAGIHHMTRHLARHLAPRHINVNAIAPGAFETRMMEQPSQDIKDAIIEEIPRRRMGNIGDIEGAVIFLSSAAGNYVTGITMPVDGGWSGCL